MTTLPLERQWRFWVHFPCYREPYSGSRAAMHEVAIDSVHRFWQYYNALPALATHFTLNGKRRTLHGRAIEGWSMFQYNVPPDWESAHNAHGCTLTCKAAFSLAEIDTAWRTLLLCIVGETLPYVEHVCGARVIDRTQSFRLEVWFDEVLSPSAIAALETWLFAANGPLRGKRRTDVLCFCNAHSACLPGKSRAHANT